MRIDYKSGRSERLAYYSAFGLLVFGLALLPIGCSDDDDDDDPMGMGGTSMTGGGSGGMAGMGMGGSSMTGGGTAGMGMGGSGMTASGGPAPNGIELPSDIFDWRVLSAVSRVDNAGSIRVVVGNDVAITAAREGRTNPWPDGTMLAHYVWSRGDNDTIPDPAVVPANFGAVTLMVKDADEYADDGGWAYGLWTGMDLMPAAAGFDRDCVNCHVDNAPSADYVFTRYNRPPSVATVAAAQPGANGVELPDGFLDWRVIGVVDLTPGPTQQIRVIVGNDTAVEAARAGNTNPWPDGSMIGHFVWAAATDNQLIEDTLADVDTVVPSNFAAITLMVRDGEAYADSGGWTYGRWTGTNLDGIAEGVEADCVGCHTANVSENDYVFTIPGQLPSL